MPAKLSRLVWLVNLLLLLILPLKAQSASQYEVTDLSPASEPSAAVISHGINNQSKVVGTRGDATYSSPFIWQNGLIDFISPIDAQAGSASGINASGHIAGDQRFTVFPTETFRAFLNANGSNRLLGVLPGFVSSFGRGLNNNGVVVGDLRTDLGNNHAFVWDAANGMRDLTPAGGGFATGVNDAGQVVGYIFNGTGVNAFRWSAANGLTTIGAGAWPSPSTTPDKWPAQARAARFSGRPTGPCNRSAVSAAATVMRWRSTMWARWSAGPPRRAALNTPSSGTPRTACAT